MQRVCVCLYRYFKKETGPGGLPALRPDNQALADARPRKVRKDVFVCLCGVRVKEEGWECKIEYTGWLGSCSTWTHHEGGWWMIDGWMKVQDCMIGYS